MKFLGSLLLILGFFGIAVFGFTMLDMGPGHTGGCVAATVNGTACPTSIVGFATHHLSAVKALTLTTSIPFHSNWLLLLVSLLLVFVLIFFRYKNLLFPKLEFLPRHLQDLTLHSLYSKRKIASWLSLLELSPALH